ncbi:MAG TPA: proteasome subunit beta [Nitrososphaerales archaeon]|nr:proteasome subunit beta [Nitrososphaerales archaeon]
MSATSQKVPEQAKYHGTTTAGIVCSDGVVLATDTRVTAGGYIAHKRGKKLLQVDSHLAVTISGGVADAQNVVDSLRYYARTYRIEKGLPIPVKSAARIMSNILFSSRFYPYIAIVILGGYDNSGGSIYNIDLFGSAIPEKVTATGSGSPVAFGVLEEGYREGMSVAKAVPLAADAIIAAMRRNVFTGDSFDIAIIDKSGFREVSEQDKAKLLAQFAGRS